MKDVSGKLVLITGAAMGMGRMYAERALTEGARALVLWDVDEVRLEVTREALAASGASVHAYPVDLSEPAAITDAAARVLGEVGVPEVLINNAGIVRSSWFWEEDPKAATEATIRVNALAPMLVARAFLPAMIEAGAEARILNVASAAGTLANPRMATYAASKWAVMGWSDSLRLELVKAGHEHVKVTTFAPSYIDTGMFAGARGPALTPIMKPEFAVHKAWRAMLRGTPVLYLPWSVGLAKAMRGVLPTRAWDLIGGKWLGVYRSMDEFRGRG